MDKQDYNRIGPTAVMCARVRAEFMELPYVDEIWEEVRHNPCALGFIYEPLKLLARIFSPKTINKVSLLEGRELAIDCVIEKIAAETGVKPSILEIAFATLCLNNFAPH